MLGFQNTIVTAGKPDGEPITEIPGEEKDV